MLKGIPRVVGLASLLLVAACDHIPYYNESLDWFSWSRYDPEVNAIVTEIPPPGELEASAPGATMGDPGTVTTTASASAGGSSAGAPLVGVRNSVGPSVTWRSTRGTP